MTTANVERKLQHLFDGSDWNVYENTILNLGVGAPGTDLLENCCDIFKKATDHRLSYERDHNKSLLFQYGPTNGTYEARHEIAKYLTKMYEDTVKTEDLFITAGATQGLQMIVATMMDFNGYVFVDEFTYMIALDAFKQHTTLHIVPVRLNEAGVDLAHLESLLKAKQFVSKTKEFWGMYYTIPTYHNPTGILFSEAVCSDLIKLARQYDLLITCDDVYNLLNFNDAVSPKRLFAYDARDDANYKGNVISNGSFSKIIAPGLRIGWLEVPARVKTTLDSSGMLNSGGCVNNYTAGILASLFQLELAQNHIAFAHAAYKERMLAVTDVLLAHLPHGCTIVPPRGGYFIWIQLAAGVDSSAFLKYCLAHERIYFIPCARFAATEDYATNALRISIAFHNRDKLVDGVRRLCHALSEYLRK